MPSVSLLAHVAASPTPANTSSNTSNTSNTPFRSLRSLLPFGPGKNSNQNASSQAQTPPRGSFSGFGSMRKSLARDRERKTSLTNLLPIISIDRPSVPAKSLTGDSYARRAASLSHLEQSTTSTHPKQQPLGEFGEKDRHSISETAPVLRSISPCPPLSADLSTIIEADSSGVSKTDPQSSSSKSPSPSTEAASLDLNTNQIAKQVYDAIMENEADNADQWLAADNAIVIDAEDDTDQDDGDENEHTQRLPPPQQSKLADNASLDIENVDPSIVALLSPNSLPKRTAGGGPHRRITPTSVSSIPRLRPLQDPTTPGSASSDTTFKARTPTHSHKRMPSSSPFAAAPEIQPTRITVTTTPEKPILPHLFGVHYRSLTSLTRSHSAHSVASAPPTPSLAIPNRLQVHHLTSSSSETHLGSSHMRTPSPTTAHAIHTPPHTPQLVSTQGSSSSASSSIPTAPITPRSQHDSPQYPPHTPTNSRIPTAATSISRQSSEPSSVIGQRFRSYHDDTGSSTGYGRASLDSRRPRPAVTSEHHVLATSTPFRRSEGGERERRDEQEEGSSPSASGRSPSPSPRRIGMLFNRPEQFRSRKRSMSVQESFRTAQSLIAGKKAELQHHRMNGGSRSNSSLSARPRGHTTREEDEDDPPPPPLPSHQRPPLHDWLGPRSVKALRAAGLLDDRERDRDNDHQVALVGKSSRERSGSVATSVMSGGSAKTTFSLLGGGGGGGSSGGRSPQHQHQHQLQHGFGSAGLGHGRAPSRMAFSDVGGGGPSSASRRGSGSGTVFSHLMHSPTLTTSTSAGSRDGRERDTPRSASTAPTSVSGASLAYMRDRERDEIQEMKERHATETGALLGALSDSQRTTRMLREENHDLRERLERLERLGDLEVENEDLRRELRGLKRELGEMKLKLQVLSGSRGPSRSGLSTPIPLVMEQPDVVLVPPSTWNRPAPPPAESDGQPEPETPRHHRRCPSETSSIFPVLPPNMTMLMHDEDHMHEQLLNGDEQTLDQSRGQQVQPARTGSRPVSFRKVSATPASAAAAGRTGTNRRSTASISPTTANFSMVTGSPGSLFLRPEHEVHLGDLETFSLDFGRVDDPEGFIGQSGPDDW